MTYPVEFIANGESQIITELTPLQIQAVVDLIATLKTDHKYTTEELQAWGERELIEYIIKLQEKIT